MSEIKNIAELRLLYERRRELFRRSLRVYFYGFMSGVAFLAAWIILNKFF